MVNQDSWSPFIDELKSFFQQQQDQLIKFYPGLRFERLKQEVISCNFQDYSEFTHWKASLQRGIPLEYLSNRAYFYKSEFFVDERVLIPRSETELLVEQAVAFMQAKKQTQILDVGTGSGVIALSIAQELEYPVEFTLSDISPTALEVAQLNRWKLAYRLHPGHDFDFIVSDRLANITGKFDLIVSNPPYIKQLADFSGVHQQVVDFEPHVALFLADAEYEQWFRLFFQQVQEHLNPQGFFLMEGHSTHLAHLANILQQVGLCAVSLLPDLAGRSRFLSAQKE